MFPEAMQLLDDICLGASIPFFTTTGGKGIVREDRVYAFGNIIQRGMVRDIIAESDAVIAIGTRLRDVDSKRRGIKIGSLLHIDVDDRWFDKNYKTELKLVGEMKEALNLLNALLKGKRFEWDLKVLKELYKKGIAGLKTSSLGFKTINIIRQAIPEETVIVCDLNLLSYWAEYHFPVYAQNGFIMARGIAPIFYSIPAGIGVKLAMSERPCLAISGDGGALPTISELSTMKNA
jgi:thiamine pyrophosphate-dependent acetolactate synthase large subunit-like protein